MIAGPVTLVAWRPVPLPEWTAASEVSPASVFSKLVGRVAGVGGPDEGRVAAGRRGRQRARKRLRGDGRRASQGGAEHGAS